MRRDAMSNRIYSATIRKGEVVHEVSIEQMNEKLYQECKEELFCPNRECSAKIVYVDVKKGNTRPYFRTRQHLKGNDKEIIEQHIDGCIYAVDRIGGIITTPKEDKSVVMNVSKEHIKGSLRRASRKSKVEDGTLTVSTRGKKHIKNATKKTKTDDQATSAGRVDLASVNQGTDEKGKEPRIPHRNTEDIDIRDYGKSIIIRGEVQDVILESESVNKYSYILLKSKEDKLTRILFGEYYKVHNEVQYGQIKFYKKYVDDLKQQGKKVRVACAGEVMKDEFQFSIIMYDYEYMVINDLSHYEIINQYILK